MNIPIRKLGKTGLEVSLLGIGGWQLGGAIRRGDRPGGLPGFVESEKIELLHRAVDLGINFCETSNVYGKSEQVLGKFLAQRPGSLIIATKCGIKPEGGVDISPGFIKASVHDSLEKLGVPSLDIYQLTVPDFDKHDVEKGLDTLRDLKQEGLIRHTGVSVKRIRDARYLIAHSDIEMMEVFYNLFDCRFNEEILPLCREKEIGVIIKSPLNKGVLTAKYGPDATFHPDDVRSVFLGKKELGSRNAWMDSFCEKFRISRETLRGFALRFLFSNPCISTVPVGVRDISQLEANAAVFSQPLLDAAALKEIEAFSLNRIGGFLWEI